MPQTCDWDTRKLALLNSHKSDVIVEQSKKSNQQQKLGKDQQVVDWELV